jgi:hypothetical protein
MDVILLSSGMGLGHYVPAVLLRDELMRRGLRAEVRVFEGLLDEGARAQIARTATAYQSNFRKALVGQRLHGKFGVQPVPYVRLPSSADRIVVFAGCWCPYLNDVPASKIDLLHVDLSPSPSWSAAREAVDSLKQSGARELWLSRKDSQGRRLVIGAGSDAPIPWTKRAKRVLVHGGGWAIGDLESTIQKLRNVSVDVLLGSRPNLPIERHDLRQFGTPVDWQPWLASAELPFPPLVVRSIDRDIPIRAGERHHALELQRTCMAVVSKPGGMSLAESLITATPVVFLTPFGDHERSNALNWINDGFAVWFDDWQLSDFAEQPLKALHLNLVAARKHMLPYDYR